MAKYSVLECLDRMEQIIEASKKIPLSSKRAVDGVELLDLIDRARIALPEEARQAEGIGAERNRITRDRGTAPSASGQVDVETAARQRSEAIIAQAENDAMQIRRGADGYAEATLESLGDTLDRTTAVVRRGLEELKRRAVD